MARVLFFAISALLCLALGDSLRCLQCHLEIGNTGCFSGSTTCTTQRKQQCRTITVSHDGVEMYRIQGCTVPGNYRCGLKQKQYGGHEVKFQCCSDSNMCNTKF